MCFIKNLKKHFGVSRYPLCWQRHISIELLFHPPKTSAGNLCRNSSASEVRKVEESSCASEQQKRDNLQESPIFPWKVGGFRCSDFPIFPTKPIYWEAYMLHLAVFRCLSWRALIFLFSAKCVPYCTLVWYGFVWNLSKDMCTLSLNFRLIQHITIYTYNIQIITLYIYIYIHTHTHIQDDRRFQSVLPRSFSFWVRLVHHGGCRVLPLISRRWSGDGGTRSLTADRDTTFLIFQVHWMCAITLGKNLAGLVRVEMRNCSGWNFSCVVPNLIWC
jgi:hypothetical protein